MSKTESARLAIEALNPDVEVIEHNGRLEPDNVIELLSAHDVIVDGADNFPTRYLLNDASVRLNKPVVSSVDPVLRRADLDLRPIRGPALPLPLPDPAPRRAGAELRRRRGSACRRESWGRRSRSRCSSSSPAPASRDRPPAPVRGAGDRVHRAQGPPRPRLPDLWAERAAGRRRGSRQVSRLRALLRLLTGREGASSASSAVSRPNGRVANLFLDLTPPDLVRKPNGREARLGVIPARLTSPDSSLIRRLPTSSGQLSGSSMGSEPIGSASDGTA